jgi:GNAT superfamily N-acetyltransferase
MVESMSEPISTPITQGHALQLRLVDYGSKEYQATIALRQEILRKPLGLSFTEEQLASESESFHLACYHQDELVGCLILKPGRADLETVTEIPPEKQIQVRQVAVAANMQGLGLGKKMMGFAETQAVGKGYRLIWLHARATALPFYETLEYKKAGELFEEIGLPHWSMYKELLAT